MTHLPALCAYCAHRIVDAVAHCANCGAPVGVADALPLATAAGKATLEVAHTAALVSEDIATTGEKVAAGARIFARVPLLWQWVAAAVGVLVLGVLMIGLLRAGGPDLSGLGTAPAIEALPVPLKTAADCRSTASDGHRCVVPGSSALLATGLSGGRDLAFSVRLMPSDQVADELRRWRSTATVVLVDGVDFVAIGPSATVWYASTRSGLRVESGAFADQAAARVFLGRVGLLR